MAFGYGSIDYAYANSSIYNAVANDGEMVKPQFVSRD
jgi:cell division protein FtsI/penicillin-binding protein 2